MARFIQQDIQRMVDSYLTVESKDTSIRKVGKDYTPSKVSEVLTALSENWAKEQNLPLARALNYALEQSRGMPFCRLFKLMHGFNYLISNGMTFEMARKKARHYADSQIKDPADPFWEYVNKEHRFLFK